MDYDQFSASATALLDRLADRVPAANAEVLREFAQVGEWGELIDELTAVLVAHHITLTRAEHTTLRDLADHAELPTAALDELPVIEDPPESDA
ncbi:hypothetical protein [Goodfellowiella coeruleoviolacea]|uniref:MafI family immunity protein n=1 Tax=Goodfellowiella coeruleoviolacea TaxID=334858 RepID=A0AAE3GAQ5_9PSEU|nr:hypothetical protein [Goodfellowiella coeruleoviolacea]MCP2163559.1 hypothetical protein [Goodfellowiella coeruleoviolacea]